MTGRHRICFQRLDVFLCVVPLLFVFPSKWENLLLLRYICWLQQCREAPYFGQNYIALLTKWRFWWRTHHVFWKMFYFVKGTSSIFISYFRHGSDRFGLWYIIFLTSEVLLLGLQDQYGIFPGPKFRYSWWYLNEQKWKSHRQLFS